MFLAAVIALSLAADGGTADAGTPPGPKAVFLMAAEPETFEKWVTAKPADRAKLKLVDQVKINQRVLVAIGLEGYELPKSRKVELLADIMITDSTGRVVLEKASAAVARNFDPVTQTAVLLKPIGSLNYGVTDPEGVYVVKVTIWDQIRGESTKVVTRFTVSR